MVLARAFIADIYHSTPVISYLWSLEHSYPVKDLVVEVSGEVDHLFSTYPVAVRPHTKQLFRRRVFGNPSATEFHKHDLAARHHES